jgi:hypothetical protein
MSKIFATLPGSTLTQEEDEVYHLWWHLQKHSRAIVYEAIALVRAKDETERTEANNNLHEAVANYTRLGGKIEDIKHFL